MTLDLCVQVACVVQDLPAESDIRRWAEAALEGRREQSELTIRLVDEAESQRLNREYRGHDRPTNVLSFSSGVPQEVGSDFIGDLVVCAPVVTTEAIAQGKEPDAHWAHMVVHGILHLQGFDHANDKDADAMEMEEVSILSRLGFPDPYRDESVA